MNIGFFEEFPTPANLAKAKLIEFRSTIYIATHSLEEFQSLSDELKKINPIVKAGYWPILPKSYWLSPLALPEEIEVLIN